MKPEEFDMVMKVHMYGTFAVCHAAWPIMREQEYGRIVNITSVNGLYGQFGQANYSAANACLDALALSRLSRGAVACSVQWPLVGGAGMGASASSRRLLISGLADISLDQYRGKWVVLHTVPLAFTGG